MKTRTYILSGLRCASCVASSIRVIKNSSKNIKDVSISLLSGECTISYENEIDDSEIIANINSLGFEAVVKSSNEIHLLNDKYLKLHELIIVCVLGILLFYISIVNMTMKNPLVPDFLNLYKNPIGFVTVSLLLALCVNYFGLKFLLPGFKALIHLHPNMDSLIFIGSITSLIYSFVYTIFTYAYADGSMYAMKTLYDSSSMIIMFMYVGKYIEQESNNHARNAINNLIDIIPSKAILVTAEEKKEVCINEINVGDIVQVSIGQRVPVDGYISKYSSYVNTSSITGESKLQLLNVGDLVLAGSIVVSSDIYVEASKVSSDTTLNTIMLLVSKSQMSKTKLSRIIDTVSYYFIPSILFISLIVLIVWLSAQSDVELAFTHFISSIVIACPCALGLAVPLANINSSSRAIKEGFVYQNSEVYEKIEKINHVIFDKTGTLTTGEFDLFETFISEKYDSNYIYSLLFNMESKSNHPIAKSICKYIKDKKFNIVTKDLATKELLGYGLQALEEKDSYFIVNLKYASENKIKIHKDSSKFILLKNNEVLLEFYLKDKINDGAQELVNYLLHKKINITILSGDSLLEVEKIAKELGIINYKAELLPSEKYEYIQGLKKDKNNHILYVGDGINDAPSLSLSDIAITPYKSSDIANASSDIYLLNDDLANIIKVFKLTKYSMKVIKFNILWTFIYNVAAISIASGLLYVICQFSFKPYMSAIVMSLSSISVILTSLTIRFKKLKK